MAEISNFGGISLGINTYNSIKDNKNNFTARSFKPEVSTTFRIFYDVPSENDMIRTEYGYIYEILYRTKDKNDALNQYEFFMDTNKYNL